MKRYSKTLTAMALVAMFALGSCKDFLSVDNYFSDELQMDSIRLSPRYLEAYLWGAAARFPDEGNFFYGGYTPGPYATDEAFTLHSGAPGMDFVLGNITADNLGTMSQWAEMYKIIRKCNNIFSYLDAGVPNLLPKDKTRLLGYTAFMRAYAYYHLLMNFGPPIILGDEVINVNLDLTAYDRERATFDEAVEYICTEFEKAARNLPLTQTIPDFGKPTQGAAYGLVARLRLIHASPLYNGGDIAQNYYSNWQRKSDDAHYIQQEYDEKRWAIAAAAARRVIRHNNGMYELYTVAKDPNTPDLPTSENPENPVNRDPNFSKPWPQGAEGIDHYRSYAEMFNGEAPLTTNKEYVWARNSDATTNSTRYAFPYSIGGINGLGITQKVVDAYLTEDGYEITNIESSYSEDGVTAQMKFFSGYRQNHGISTMYDRREKRFYASIGFSECFWPCTSAMGTQGTNVTISYYYDSSDGKTGPTDPNYYPITGYVLKKAIHPQDSWLDAAGSKRTDKVFGIIRYAEILLAYAEALNNLQGSYTLTEDEMYGLNEDDRKVLRDWGEIKKSFNLVRYRAGLPGLIDELQDDRVEVQRLIERERMVELLCENHRYFDVRRWGKYELSEDEPILGMNTEGTKEAYVMRIMPPHNRIQQRRVDRRMIFLPLPRNEIKRLPSCDQNPGWD
jgi:hypothetical protein